MLAMGSFLDPPYKMKMIEFYYSQIYSLNGEKEINNVHNVIRKLYSEYEKNFLSSIPLTHDIGSSRDSRYISDKFDEIEGRKRRFAQFMKENAQRQ